MTSRVRVARAPLLSVLLALGAALLLVFPTTPSRAATDSSATAEVTFTRIEPLVLTSGDTATISVRVTNTSTEALTDATVHLRAQSWTPGTRSMLIRWLDPDRYTAALLLDSTSISELAPGASTTVTFQTDSASFEFDSWGPRGIEAELTTSAGRIGVTRSWVTWWDDSATVTTSVGVVVPAAQTAAEIANQDTTRVAALETLASRTGVTVVADPSVLATSSLTAVLPWMNADVDALLAAGSDGAAQLESAITAARQEAGGVVVNWLDALPADTTSALHNADVVLVESDTIEGTDALSYTPTARMSDGQVLLLDSGLTDILAGQASVLDSTYSLDTIQQRQLLAAMTAAISRERPAEARTVLAAAAWDVTTAELAVTSILTELPWVTPVSLTTAMTGPLNSLVTLSAAQTPSGGISAAELTQVERSRSALAVVQELSDQYAPQVEQWERQLDSVFSRALRASTAQRTEILNTVQSETLAVERGVAVQPGSDVLMVSSESEMPVTVTNSLEYAVTIQVGLDTDDSRLTATDSVAVTLDPGSTSTVRIPVQAAASADLEVRVVLTTTAGQPVGSADSLQVRIRPDWENWMVWGSVGCGVLVLALGIVKTVQRNRATGRSQEIEQAAAQLDRLALQRAEEADRREGRA